MSITIGWDTTTGRQTLKTLIRKEFLSTDREPLVEHKDIFNTIATTDEYERDIRYAGLGPASELTDGEEIGLQDPVLDTTKDYRQGRWGNGFRITAGMKKFNKIGLMKSMTKDLKRTMVETKDADVMTLLNNATSSTYAGFDTYALAYNTHTCLDDSSTTYDNYLDAALGVTSYESAKIYFRTLVDDQGQTFVAKPDTLVVNPYYEREANELIRSTLRYNTGDNAINVYKGDSAIKVCSRLTSSTVWYLMAKSHNLFDLNVFTSQEPNLKVKDAPDNTEDTVVISSQWYKWGFGDPRMVFCGDT
jgi:phage major head subunit gpT-like protein